MSQKKKITADLITTELNKHEINDDVAKRVYEKSEKLNPAKGFTRWKQVENALSPTFQFINNLKDKKYCLNKLHVSEASVEDFKKMKEITKKDFTDDEFCAYLKKVSNWNDITPPEVSSKDKAFIDQLKDKYRLSKCLYHASAEELREAGVPDEVANSGQLLQKPFEKWENVKEELGSEVYSEIESILKKRFILGIDLKTAIKKANGNLQNIDGEMTGEIAEKISNNTVTEWEQLYSEKDRKLHEVFKTLKKNYTVQNVHYNNLCDYVLSFQSLSIIPEGHYSPYILQENFKS